MIIRDYQNEMIMKKYFLEKKSSRPGAALVLAGREKGEVILDSPAPNSDFFLLSNYYLTHQYEFGDPNWGHEKT